MNKKNYYVADFETTVLENSEEQTHTEVWCSAITKLYDTSEYVKIDNNIHDFMNYVLALKNNSIIYFHNLKFDGTFILDYIIKVLNLGLAFDNESKDFYADKDMPNNTYKIMISNLGIWYSITVKFDNRIIYFRDSLKLLPFTLKKIGKDFKTKHQKLDIEYVGERHAYGFIADNEKEYIKNDVLVIKEALEVMFSEGHNKLTIGSCCMKEFKKTIKYNYDYGAIFPDLSLVQTELAYESNADTYIRRSYKGAWCYLKEGCENKIFYNGQTYDVNSLYPSVMHSKSGNCYPIGRPTFWSGNFIPDRAKQENKYYFVRIKTSFKLKDGFLPFLQIKHSYLYKSNEMLKTSSYTVNDKTYENIVELTLTMTDFELLKKHYHLYNFEILDGCYFGAVVGLFDDYINHYMQIKIESKGAIRQIAKLFLNNLYGKFATSTDNLFKLPYLENNIVKYKIVQSNDKQGGFIAIGSAITSYAREFTITASQLNIDNFIYADTDSMHVTDCEIKGISIHESEFCCWKNESSWNKGLFVRQKTYIEYVTHEDGKIIKKPHYNVKCAGMSERCKNLFLKSIGENIQLDKLTKKEVSFLLVKRKLTDFKRGLTIPSKLLPKVIDGGTLLIPTTFEMR